MWPFEANRRLISAAKLHFEGGPYSPVFSSRAGGFFYFGEGVVKMHPNQLGSFTPCTVPALLKQRQVLAIATTRDRALTMRSEGYTIEATEREWLFFVRRPAPHVNRKTGEIIEGYLVDFLDADVTCSCQQFLSCGDCKHRLFALVLVREMLTILGPSISSFGGSHGRL